MLSFYAGLGQGFSSNSDGWQPIDSAPKDGTPVEVRCTYGVAPWYGLFRWTDSPFPGWHKVSDENMGFTPDSSFSWRPYGGNSQQYQDPTGGAQDTDEYWLQAAGCKS